MVVSDGTFPMLSVSFRPRKAVLLTLPSHWSRRCHLRQRHWTRQLRYNARSPSIWQGEARKSCCQLLFLSLNHVAFYSNILTVVLSIICTVQCIKSLWNTSFTIHDVGTNKLTTDMVRVSRDIWLKYTTAKRSCPAVSRLTPV